MWSYALTLGLASLQATAPAVVASLPHDVAAAKMLLVRRVLLAEDAPLDGSPTVRVSFDILNEGATTVTDIVVALQFVDVAKPIWERVDAPELPIRIASRHLLRPGQSMNFALRLKNVSARDCNCVPKVSVVSATGLLEDEQPASEPVDPGSIRETSCS